MQFPGMFNPMMFMVPMLPMNPLVSQAFQNLAVPNLPITNFQLPSVGMGVGTCDQQLEFASSLIVGIAQAFFQARDLLNEVRTLAAAEGLPDVEAALANAVAITPSVSPPELSPLAPCEQKLDQAQTILRGVLDRFDTAFGPAFALSFQFLRTRTEQADARDLLARITVFVQQVRATILDATRRFLPPVLQ